MRRGPPVRGTDGGVTASALVEVRFAVAADASLLASLGAETFAETYAADNTPEDLQEYLARHFAPEIQARELSEPGTRFLIAEVGGESAGFARLRDGPPPAAHGAAHPVEIVQFYARARWIGRGVGGALMDRCLAVAREGGSDLVWLGVWERNARARAFYAKWGFREIGTKTFTVGSDVQDDLVLARAP